jgi:hypothetical protein
MQLLEMIMKVVDGAGGAPLRMQTEGDHWVPVTIRPANRESPADCEAFFSEGERRQSARERAEKRREDQLHELRTSFDGRLTQLHDDVNGARQDRHVAVAALEEERRSSALGRSQLNQRVEDLESCVDAEKTMRLSDAEEASRELAEALQKHQVLDKRLSAAAEELDEERLRLVEEKKRRSECERELTNLRISSQAPSLELEHELRDMKGKLHVCEETIEVQRRRATINSSQNTAEQSQLKSQSIELGKQLKTTQDMLKRFSDADNAKLKTAKKNLEEVKGKILEVEAEASAHSLFHVS